MTTKSTKPKSKRACVITDDGERVCGILIKDSVPCSPLNTGPAPQLPERVVPPAEPLPVNPAGADDKATKP